MSENGGFCYRNNEGTVRDGNFLSKAVHFWYRDFYLDLLPANFPLNRLYRHLPDICMGIPNSCLRDDEMIYKFAHYDKGSPESAYLEKLAGRKKFSEYETYTPYHFAGLASKICCSSYELWKTKDSYVSEKWKLLNEIRDPYSLLDMPDYAEEYFYILEAIQIINKSLSITSNQKRIVDVFPADPMGWAIPVEVCKIKPDRKLEGIGSGDILGFYEYWQDPIKSVGTNVISKYPHNIQSKIVLCLDKMKQFADRIVKSMEDAEKNGFGNVEIERISDLSHEIWKQTAQYRLIYCKKLERKYENDYYNRYYRPDDIRAYLKYTFRTNIYAYVLTHELFHAWQDYHVGLLKHSQTRLAPKWLEDESETLAESFAINFVWSILKDKQLAYLLYADRLEEEKKHGKNGYTEIVRRKVLYMDGYKEFFPKLSDWEDVIIKECYK